MQLNLQNKSIVIHEYTDSYIGDSSNNLEERDQLYDEENSNVE